MAGGIFPGRPFALNPKCLYFSGAMVTAYWVLPCKYDPHKWWATALIASASYVGLAWYDHAYDCKDKMRAGALNPIFGAVKPPVRAGRYT